MQDTSLSSESGAHAQDQDQDQEDNSYLFVKCPVFERNGFCPCGVNCRWASSHVDATTGANEFNVDRILGKSDYDEAV